MYLCISCISIHHAGVASGSDMNFRDLLFHFSTDWTGSCVLIIQVIFRHSVATSYTHSNGAISTEVLNECLLQQVDTYVCD